MTGTCIIPSDPVVWLEGDYEAVIAKAWAERKSKGLVVRQPRQK